MPGMGIGLTNLSIINLYSVLHGSFSTLLQRFFQAISLAFLIIITKLRFASLATSSSEVHANEP